MDALRIGLVGPAAPWAGGISRFTSDLVSELERRGPLRWMSWRPSARFNPPGTELDLSIGADPRAEPALGLLDVRSWARVGAAMRERSALLLTVTHPLLLLAYRPLVASYRQGGGRVVLVCHNVLPHRRSPLARRLAARLLALGDVTLVHAEAEARLARSICPTVQLVPAFHPASPASQWSRPPGRRRLLAFGYVRPYKGLSDLLRVLPHLPEVELRVVGRFWEPLGRYRALAHRLGVADRVAFEDRYVRETDIPEIFAACDVVVCPYRQASQSGVVQLAFANGRPVVATAVGGLAEAIADGVTGAIATPRDALALADAVRRALDLPLEGLHGAIRNGLALRSWARYADLVVEAARV